MKLKLDENIDLRILPLLQLAGHDVATVPGQNLNSAPDRELIQVCQEEKRCLVTCDRGFSNRLRFDPMNYSGIVVIRLPARQTLVDWREAIETLILGLEKAEVKEKLWVIRQGKIQEFESLSTTD